MTDPKTPPNPETLVAQAGSFIDQQTGAIIPPLHPSTTFARNEPYEQIGGRGYSRDDNPTYDQVEHVLARLEGGAAAKLFASGMEATATVFQAMPAGSQAVVSKAIYFGTPKWLRRYCRSAKPAPTPNDTPVCCDWGKRSPRRSALRAPPSRPRMSCETPAPTDQRGSRHSRC